MTDSSTGQVSGSAAEIYDRFFLPALFERWTAIVCDAAEVKRGDRVLDIACGTGVLALEAARRVGEKGSATGIDLNPGMLAVACGKSTEVDWRQGAAELVPFTNASFDAVVSQFGLMFFEDRAAALAEMWRLLVPGGRLAVAVWAGLERTPGYSAMVALLDRLFGAGAAEALRAPYCLGDPDALAGLFAKAGIEGAEVKLHQSPAHFPSLESWVETDIKGWTLSETIDDDQFALLLREAKTELAGFVQPDGSVEFAHPALIVTARR